MGYLPILIDRSKPTPALDWATMIAPTISGSLSFICSSIMVLRFIKHRKKAATKVKERLLVGLSVGDMLFSAACAMSTFAGPAYLQDFVDYSYDRLRTQKLKGNEATCNLQGWLYQFGIVPQLYTACLSVYYYLSICHRKRDREILRCIEPTMHVVVWIWALVTASLGLILDLVVYIGAGGCRVSSSSNFTERCTYDPTFPECSNPGLEQGAWLLFSFTMPPLAISILVILIMMTLIYRQVSLVEKKGNRWNFGRALAIINRQAESTKKSSIQASGRSYLSNNASALMASADGATLEGPTVPKNLEGGCAASIGSAVSEESKTPETAHQAQDESNRPASSAAGASLESGYSQQPSRPSARISSVRLSSGSLASLASSFYSQNSRISGSSNSNFSCDSWESQLSGVPGGESRRRRRRRRRQEKKLSNRVKDTGIVYIVGFFLCYTIPIINVSNSEPDPMLMLFLGGLTLPAQGIWNFVFYTRDRMKTIRKRNPDETWRNRLVEAIFGFD